MSKKTLRPPSRAALAPVVRLASEVERVDEMLRRKRWNEARELLESLNGRHPKQPELLRRLVNVYYELHDTHGYQRAAERLSDVTPDDPDLTIGLAGAYLTNMLIVSAVDTFQHFLDRWPNHARARDARKTVAEFEGKLSELLGELGLSGPDAREIARLHEEAQSLLAQGQYAGSRTVGEKLLRRRPDFVSALNNISLTYALEGRFDQAIATTQRALTIAPNDLHALANLTRCLVLSGRLDEARVYAERLKTNAEERVDAWVKKAEALSFLGDDEGVFAAFDGGRREGVLDPPLGNPILYHLAAVAELRLGREGEARQHWQRALKLMPGLTLAADNLADSRKPVDDRHGPWPWSLDYWVSRKTIDDIVAAVQPSGRTGSDHAVGRSVRRSLQDHPELVALMPLLLDRGDPVAREFALRTALAVKTPEMLAALRDFALGKRGPVHLRMEAAQAAVEAGFIPPGLVRMWLAGEWQDVLLLNFEITPEPTQRHSASIQQLAEEGLKAVRAGDADRAERIFKQALELAPDAPDLLNNLGAAYESQGRRPEALDLLRAVHERHPDYLFGRTAMAQLFVRQGKIVEAKNMLQPLLSRSKLHYSEFAALCATQFEVYLADGKGDGARSWLDMWASVDPDDPKIAQLRRRLPASRGLGFRSAKR